MMKILFECDDGSYVVELCKHRLFAKIPDKKDVLPTYSTVVSKLLNPGSFHEYRGKNNKMLETRLKNRLKDDLEKVWTDGQEN